VNRRKWLRRVGLTIATLIAIAITVWAIAALYFDLPSASLRKPVAAVYLVGISAAALLYRRVAFLILLAGFVIVLAWWLSLKPSNNANWQADVAETAWAEVDGNRVAIHNVRNCDYKAEFDYHCNWETRTFDLSKLRGLDIALTYWGSPWIAHPIITFDFGDDGHVPISIETRKVVGKGYSAILGFFRQYELIYIVSDERDLIRLRTNYRTGEEVYLFHTVATPQQARGLFLQYLDRINELHKTPEWYNALTNNCTTNIAVSEAAREGGRTPWDWRILLNGHSDEMMYEHHQLATDSLSLKALKERVHINAAARQADQDPNFSAKIREGRPGFSGQH
jgi:Domain of unknown function (DUF4105)